jgi:hypothetical protein
MSLAVAAWLALTAAPACDRSCEGLVVWLDDPGQAALGAELAARACARLAELEVHFPGVRSRGEIRLRVTADMASYRALAGRAWFIAAVLRGEEIVTQPGRALERVADLDQLLAHELTHLLLRRSAGPGLPRWLDEGLAQWLAGERVRGRPPEDEAALRALEARLRAPDPPGEAARREDYRAAVALVGRLVDQVGLEALLGALPALRRGGRDPLELPVAGRSLRERLFDRPVDGLVDGD